MYVISCIVYKKKSSNHKVVIPDCISFNHNMSAASGKKLDVSEQTTVLDDYC